MKSRPVLNEDDKKQGFFIVVVLDCVWEGQGLARILNSKAEGNRGDMWLWMFSCDETRKAQFPECL